MPTPSSDPEPVKVWSKGPYDFELFEPGLPGCDGGPTQTSLRVRLEGRPYRLFLGSREFCRQSLTQLLTQLSRGSIPRG